MFDLPEELNRLRTRVRAFVDERVLPNEAKILAEDREGKRDTLRALQAEVRAAGMWTPHLPKDLGGGGLGVMGMCALFREMGRSPVGAAAFHCDAPDQGNMDLLVQVGTVEHSYTPAEFSERYSEAFSATVPDGFWKPS